jgi:hypothetical protein
MRPLNLLTRYSCIALLTITGSVVFAEAGDALSEQGPPERAPLMVGTTTIQANEEEPMTTIIMPWRDSAPVEIDDKPIQLVTEELLPIDPEVFRRQFQYYNAPP